LLCAPMAASAKSIAKSIERLSAGSRRAYQDGV
jgi:hypothetical protein